MRAQMILVAVMASLIGAVVVAQDVPAQPNQKTAEGSAAKQGDDLWWKTKVPFEEIPVKITNWSEAKNGVRIGMSVKGAWYHGGKVNGELWIHNQSDDELSFIATAGGKVSITVKDADGHPHFLRSDLPKLIPLTSGCTLPAGYVAQVSDFSFSFGESDDTVYPTRSYQRFEGLGTGPYYLRVAWTDTLSLAAKPGYWRGELVAKEIKFTLGSADTE